MPRLRVICAWLLRQGSGLIFGIRNVENDFLTLQNKTTACFEKSESIYPVMRQHILEEPTYLKPKYSKN